MATKINLTALAAKTRSVAPKVAAFAVAATVASVAYTALKEKNEEAAAEDVVETDSES
jgi:uncharacterized membrane protein YebE (DUF533 family)